MHPSSLLVARALVVLLVAGCWLGAAPGGAHADEGPWSWPLAGAHKVSRPFAAPLTTYGRGHRGADLPAAPGAQVLAAGAGRVSYAGLLAGRGVVVVVHGALRTTYEPVTATVPVGALVSAGERVGVLEAAHAGCRREACLHWGLRRGEEYLDPVRLVERGPVRLLPVGADRAPSDIDGAGAQALRPSTASPQDAAANASPPTAGPADRAPARAFATAASDAGRTLAPAQAREPAWSLRAAEAPLVAAAVAALVAGIGLLARGRPSPDDPPTAAGPVALTGAALPEPPAAPAPVAPVLELSVERERRRSA